jgi:hypothetical protein
MTIDGKSVPVSFDQQAFVDELRFANQSGWKELNVGKGKLLITSYPVELSEGSEARCRLRTALHRAGIEPPYETSNSP